LVQNAAARVLTRTRN